MKTQKRVKEKEGNKGGLREENDGNNINKDGGRREEDRMNQRTWKERKKEKRN